MSKIMGLNKRLEQKINWLNKTYFTCLNNYEIKIPSQSISFQIGRYEMYVQDDEHYQEYSFKLISKHYFLV